MHEILAFCSFLRGKSGSHFQELAFVFCSPGAGRSILEAGALPLPTDVGFEGASGLVRSSGKLRLGEVWIRVNNRQCEAKSCIGCLRDIYICICIYGGRSSSTHSKHLYMHKLSFFFEIPLTFFRCSLMWQDAYNVVAKEKDREVLGKFDGRIISGCLYKRLKKHPCKAYDAMFM